MKGTTLAILCFASAFSHGQNVVWDQGPGTGMVVESNVGDYAFNFNVVDSLRLDHSAVVDTYVEYGDVQVADGFFVRLYADAGGHAGSVLYNFAFGSGAGVLVGQDLQGLPVYEHRISLAGNPITLDANTTYWVGASYADNHIGTCAVISAPQDGRADNMFGTTYNGFETGGDLMYRLEGPVPEPSSCLALSLGLGALTFIRRQRCR